MSTFCNLTIIGRLTRDPELKNVGGKDVAKISVAWDKYKPDADGQKACFMDCDVWGKSAEYITNYGAKGRLVVVMGRLESRKHDDKTYWTLKADNVTLLDRGDQATTTPAVGEYDPFAQD